MAILEDQIPEDIIVLSDPAKFKFTMSGIVSVNSYGRFGYQLLDTSNEPITQPEAWTPKEGVSFPLWFSKDLRERVYTAVPQCTVPTRTEPEMVLDYKLKYWEQIFNTDSCESSVVGEQEITGLTILNSANQFWGRLERDNYFPLTYYPPFLKMCPDQKQLYYLYIKNPIDITVKITTADGTVQNSTTATYGVGAHSIVLDPVALGSDADTDRIVIDTPDAGQPTGLDQLARVYVNECCEENISVAFQCFAGGYKFMHFDCIQREKSKVKATEICRYVEPSEFPNDAELTTGGLHTGDIKSFKEITFIKILKEDSLSHRRFYESMLNSGSFYWYFMDEYNVEQMVKIRPKSGSLVYYENDDLPELKMTFRISQDYRYPNFVI